MPLYHRMYDRVYLRSKYSHLYEQIWNSRAYRLMYHASPVDVNVGDLLKPSNKFYKYTSVPDDRYRYLKIIPTSEEIPCLFLSPSRKFVLDYANNFRSDNKFLYTVTIDKELNLFNFSSSKDVNSLKLFDEKIYNLYSLEQRDATLKTRSTNPRNWMSVEIPEVIETIRDLGYAGFNNYGVFPNDHSLPGAENIAIFEAFKVTNKESINDIDEDRNIAIKVGAEFFADNHDRINNTTDTKASKLLIKELRKHLSDNNEIEDLVELMLSIFDYLQLNKNATSRDYIKDHGYLSMRERELANKFINTYYLNHGPK